MISPYEIVLKLDDSLDLVRVVFFEKKQKFGLNSCLVVVLLLVFNHLDGDKLVSFVVFALEHLTKSTFAD